MTTITLSGVEQAAVLNHLRIQRSRLIPGSTDEVLLDALIVRIGINRVVDLERVEAVLILRFIREQTASLLVDMMALEERRLRGGHDGLLENAHRALDVDRTVLEDVTRRLWAMIMAP